MIQIGGMQRHPSTLHIAQFFDSDHLPDPLRAVALPCEYLAAQMIGALKDGPEMSAGMRKLLEAKDCFVRQALIDMPDDDEPTEESSEPAAGVRPAS